jgi:uncharacterized protein (DUF58 family)
VADALDFHGARPCQPGEGSRRIHWKNTARTGTIHVVEWEENMAADAVVLLDTQAATIAGPAGDDTLEAAITLTASIALHLLESGYQFQMFCWQATTAGGLEMQHLQARSSAAVDTVLRSLAAIAPVESESATLPSLAERAIKVLKGGRYAIALGSTRADLEGTLRVLNGGGARQLQGQAVALDAASYEDPREERHEAVGGFSRHVAGAASRGIRVVHRRDSIAAALERVW